MTAKEYLMQIHRLDEDIKANKRRVIELESSIGNVKAVNYSGDKISGSGDPDTMAAQVARLVDLEAEINSETVQLQEKKNKIIGEIRNLEDTRYVVLLTMRYVDCSRWEKIAVDMNLTLRRVYQIHGRALNAFKMLDVC